MNLARNIERILKALMIFILIFSSILIFQNSYLNKEIGDFFFGKIPKLYNVNVAEYFYKRASYPFFDKPTEYAHYQLARIYFIKGKLKESLYEANEELELYPDHMKAYYILGLTYGYLNQEEKAIEMFTQYIDRVPATWAGRNDKAWLQFRIGDIDGALETLSPVVHLTNNIWIQNSYGVMLMNKGKYSEAKKALEYASAIAETMTAESWGYAYPGNDPRIYSTGLAAMKKSIRENLLLTESKL